MDITYIPMTKGFIYSTAIIDVYSRKIVGWGISNSMSKQWCLDVLNDAISRHGKPKIINSDQGSQYTCLALTIWKRKVLKYLWMARAGLLIKSGSNASGEA
jgi:putative transposase